MSSLALLPGVSSFSFAATKEEQANAPRYCPDWLLSSVMYQINLRAFTPEGTLQAATGKLESLAKMNVSIVYLCPFFTADDDENRQWWTPRQKASNLNNPRNPYRIKDYYKVDPEYGTTDDLKLFVDKAHSLGMKVFFDVVYLHCGPTAVFIKDHPDFVKRDKEGQIINSEWHFPEINFENRELRQYLYDNMAYWMKKVGVDGYRCDAVTHTPLDFWEEAHERLEKVNPDVVLLAEGNGPNYQAKAYDICYSYFAYEAMNSSDARKITARCKRPSVPPGARFIRFLDQHDIANNDWDNRVEKRFGFAKINSLFVFAYMLYGIPMIYCGQEVCDKNRHSIFGHAPLDDNGSVTGPPLVIDWNNGQSKEGKERFQLLTVLGQLRKDYADVIKGKTIWLENSAPQAVLSFVRSSGNRSLLTLINLSNKPVTFTVTTDGVIFKTTLLGNGRMVNGQYELPANGYAILSNG